MKNILKILTFIFVASGLLIARQSNINTKSNVSMKVNKYYFDVNYDEDTLYKKRSWKRRKLKRKPRK